MLNARQCGAEVLITVLYSSKPLTYSSKEPLFRQIALCLAYTRVYNPILEYSPSKLQFCSLASPYSSIHLYTRVYTCILKFSLSRDARGAEDTTNSSIESYTRVFSYQKLIFSDFDSELSHSNFHMILEASTINLRT